MSHTLSVITKVVTEGTLLLQDADQLNSVKNFPPLVVYRSTTRGGGGNFHRIELMPTEALDCKPCRGDGVS